MATPPLILRSEHAQSFKQKKLKNFPAVIPHEEWSENPYCLCVRSSSSVMGEFACVSNWLILEEAIRDGRCS
jgi:hypothetical protein